MKLIEETDGKDGTYTVEIPWRDYHIICSALSYINNFWKRDIDTALFECHGEDVARINKDLHLILRGKNRKDEEA